MAASVAPVLDQVNVTGMEPLSLSQPTDELFEGENDSKTGPVETGGELGFGGVLGAVVGASFGLSLGVWLAATSGVAPLLGSGSTPPVPRANSKVRRTTTMINSAPPTTASVVMATFDRVFVFRVAAAVPGSTAGAGGVKRSVGVSSLIGGPIHS